jgi:hypothetical protein
MSWNIMSVPFYSPREARKDQPTPDLQKTEIKQPNSSYFNGGRQVITCMFRTLGGSSFDSEDRRVKISSF